MRSPRASARRNCPRITSSRRCSTGRSDPRWPRRSPARRTAPRWPVEPPRPTWKSTSTDLMGAINPLIFREYDVRGLVGRDLHRDAVVLLGEGDGTRVAGAGGRTVAFGPQWPPASPGG